MIQQNFPVARLKNVGIILLLIVVALILFSLTDKFTRATLEDPLLRDSTLGELAVWMSGQTGEEEIESFLGNYAENWAQSLGEETLAPEIILQSMKNGLLTWLYVLIVTALIGAILVYVQPRMSRYILLILLIGIDCLLFVVPVLAGDNTLPWILLSIFLLLIILLMIPRDMSRVLGFFVVLSALFIVWESSKMFASALDYKITAAQPEWVYDTYPTLDDALQALDTGEIDAVMFDRRDLADVMPAFPPDSDQDDSEFPYPDLRYLNNLGAGINVLFFPVEPEFPGRLKFAVQADSIENWTSINDFRDVSVATVSDTFAETSYLAVERKLVLVDLKILNDINLPHLQTIVEAFLQPARRNGSQLLVRILADAGLYTMGEAVPGFIIGAVLGLVLGSVFAHSNLLQRSLLPYVVASQTVPILAIAPMVVIWLGASQFSVAVIAAYLTFFPVTINTLRGLTAPSQNQVDLMQSYAASRWTILWKLRFPAALPYIFTALKISATASVVGAIIGELPSGIGDGLGRAILDFSSDYSLTSTPKLWASIVMAAQVGIFFFIIVTITERLILGRYIRNL